MEFAPLAITLLALLLWRLALGKDRRVSRLGILTLDGIPRPETRIIKIKSWPHLRTGLLNHVSLARNEGLLLLGARAVHTRGMLFPIDVVFLDRQGTVLRVEEGVQPGRRRLSGPSGTRMVLELKADTARKLYGITANTRIGVTQP